MEDSKNKIFNLKRVLFGKISKKIFFLFFIVAFLSLLILIGLVYYASINSLKAEIKDNLENSVQSRTNHIQTYFYQNIERIKLITSRTQLKKDIENYIKSPNKELNAEIVRKLNDSKSSIKEIDKICFIDLEGIFSACSDGSFEGVNSDKEDFFLKGKMIEGAYFFKQDKEWKIVVSGPIVNNGRLMGVIITIESFDELEEIIHDRTGLGKSGEVLVAFKDNNRNIIYPIPRLFENESTDFIGIPIKSALKGESVFFEDTLDYRKVHVIAATRYIPEIKLGVVAKIDREEAIGAVRNRLIFIFIMCFLFILFIFALSSFFISKIITKPIKVLTDAAQKMRSQDFKTRVNIKSGDELQEMGDAFNSAAESLETIDEDRKQIDKAKTEFLSITSHELRSPMTPMKAQLQMILGEYFGKLTKEQKESLQVVLSNTERLDKIIVDFLEISRIEAARLKFNFIKYDLTKTIESVVNEMKGFMPEKNIKIETHIEKLPIIEVDPDRVSQVLRNLINNAIKFVPNGGKIEISAKLFHGLILFSVKDNGVGIAEKDQVRLFEPFYQVDNMYQHKSGGTGLGLAISKGIVESQNGKIWFSSQPQRGSIFYFTVPLKPVRDMRPIKLLFSETEKYDSDIKDIFKEFIGPLGEKEFENLKNSFGINIESVNRYISDLTNKGILRKDKSEEFKSKVAFVLNKQKEGKI